MGSSPPPDHLFRTRDAYSHLLRRLSNSINDRFFIFCFLLIVTYLGFLRASDHPPSSPQTIFFYLDSFSFFFSLSGLLFSAFIASSPLVPPNAADFGSVEKEIAAQRVLLVVALPRVAYSTMFLLLSLTCFILAFPFGGLSTVRDSKAERLAIIIPSVVGIFAFISFLMLGLREVSRRCWRIFLADSQLWEDVKDKTMFGYALTRYMEIVFGDFASGRAASEKLGCCEERTSIEEREGISQDDVL